MEGPGRNGALSLTFFIPKKDFQSNALPTELFRELFWNKVLV